MIGDIIYINVFGQPMVVVNNLEMAFDLFQERSSNYSDRWVTPMMRL